MSKGSSGDIILSRHVLFSRVEALLLILSQENKDTIHRVIDKTTIYFEKVYAEEAMPDGMASN
jgi:hypothetical protein